MNSQPATTSRDATTPRQLLTFHLGNEVFGIDILRIREIRGWSPVTRLPASSPQVLGVLNLRGAIVPILDLRLRFHLASAAFTTTTVVIVTSIETADGVRDCGLVVDAVSDVIDVEVAMLRSPPRMSGSAGEPGYVESLIAMDDRMVILLNADELVREDLGDDATAPRQRAA
jgi:purine-binding chemotaxis protein CheW